MHDLLPSARRLAALVGDITDRDLDAPTPCADYTVADLLDHIWGLAIAFREAARKEQGRNASPPPAGSGEALPSDWRTRIPADLEQLGVAWQEPEAWEGTTIIAGSEMPAPVVGAVALDEVVTHGWDLARALGREYEVDDASVAGAMDFVGPISAPDAPRPPIFGPAVAVADDASPLDRLIGLTGRDPGWSRQQR